MNFETIRGKALDRVPLTFDEARCGSTKRSRPHGFSAWPTHCAAVQWKSPVP